MGYWYYLLVATLVIPASMIVLGLVFWKRPPKDINCIYGFRTKLSRSSQEAWDFSQKYAGRYWFIVGILTLLITIPAMVNSMELSRAELNGFAICVVLAQLLPLISVLPMTEQALRKHLIKK